MTDADSRATRHEPKAAPARTTEPGQADHVPADIAELLAGSGRGSQTWREGYPYDKKMTRHEYEDIKRSLQIELLKRQSWVKQTGQRVVLIVERRDAADRAGTTTRL